MNRRLVTSALPYVNNVPHLGNLIQVLSADVFSRASRLLGHETLYICGTDEYGTATETKAQEEGISPKELCDRFYKIHSDIYKWFGIGFDKFGRTSSARQTEITQSLFMDLDKAGFIKEETIEQLYCESCQRFLADRYVRGACPQCGYPEARGDQCESCGKLLDPTELIDPKCATCGNTPVPRKTKHLYIDLPAIKPKLEAWMKEASIKGFWANNAIQMTQAWIRDGLKPRAITRDLKWGIPVPKPGYEDKVFYVWFDAPIGYLSITACAGDEQGFDWKDWWMKPEEVELFQFIGKDNIPFHTVIFPSTLLGSGRNWTMLHHMSSSEYLNYESGKFSKSKGVGVFGNDVMETGIPADVWRFYIFYNRPEKSDVTFTWNDFMERVNGELIGNLGNLANRTLSFVQRFYEGKIPSGKPDPAFWGEVGRLEQEVADRLEKAELRDAFRTAFQIADLANKRFQMEEPWKARTENPEKAASLLSDLCYVLRDLAIMMHPYMPYSMEKLASFFGHRINSASGMALLDEGFLSWKNIGRLEGLSNLHKVDVLFGKLEEEQVAELRARYSGSQKERAERNLSQSSPKNGSDKTAVDKKDKEIPVSVLLYPELSPTERFVRLIDLRVAKITRVQKHPKADKLYIETLDDGSGSERTIISGLVPFYTEEELLGKHIVLVNNLKPAMLRGAESRGMLLAASAKLEDGTETLELLEAPWARPGDKLQPEGVLAATAAIKEVDIDNFFSIPITARDGNCLVDGRPLSVSGRLLNLSKVLNGKIA